MVRRRELGYVDPARRRGRLYRAYARVFGTTRPAMWFARTVLWRVDPHLLRLTGGRFSLSVGIPRALLETTGARTGVPRRHAVIYFHDGERPTIVASKFGLPEDPAWFHNVRAHPDIVFGGQPYRAEVVGEPRELERLWALADAVFPPFATYRERAARSGRTIPILQLVAAERD